MKAVVFDCFDYQSCNVFFTQIHKFFLPKTLYFVQLHYIYKLIKNCEQNKYITREVENVFGCLAPNILALLERMYVKKNGYIS